MLTRILLSLTFLSAAVFAAEDGAYPATKPPAKLMDGVEMSPVPNAVQEREGLTPDQGVYVQSVFENTAAKEAGVQPGDVILAINGSPISSMTDLRNEVGLGNLGDPIEHTVLRNGQQVLLTGALKPWPEAIPFQPIDAEGEKRFRDWQTRRQERQQKELDEVAKRAQELAQQLGADDKTDQRPGAATRAFADAERPETKNGGLPPWRLTWRIRARQSKTMVATVTPAPLVTDPDGAWKLGWRIAPPANPAPTAAPATP